VYIYIFKKMNVTVDINPQELAHALSGEDMQRLCPGSQITLYNELINKRASDCIGPSGAGFVLFVERDGADVTSGHWLALIQRNHELEIFDPYGSSHAGGDPWYLDHTFIPRASLIALKEASPVVDAWSRREGLSPIYNPYRYQAMRNGINTCGRHCAARVMNSHFNTHDYRRYIQHYCALYKCTPDMLVTAWTKR
jgi:hypothetical protein